MGTSRGQEQAVKFSLSSKMLNVLSSSVLSNSLQPPWTIASVGSSDHGDSPGKNIVLDSHAPLQGIFPGLFQ